MSSWQQILALDAKYNAYRAPDNPQFRTLYIRRRSQLLKESAVTRESPDFEAHQANVQFRKKYIRLRAQLLAQRYGNPLGLTASTGVPSECGVGSRSVSLASQSVSRSTVWTPEDDSGGDNSAGNRRENAGKSSRASSGGNLTNSVVPTPLAEASRAMVGGKTLGENYAFAGMHHVFEHHRDAVLRLSFAPDDKHRLACCSKDSNLSVFDLGAYPPYLNKTLSGHSGPVRCFEWSLSGDQLISGSDDTSTRYWDVKSGSCLRVVTDPQRARVLSCAFQPLNNNVVATGNEKGFINIFNVSTGKPCGPSEKIVAISAATPPPNGSSTQSSGTSILNSPGVAAAAASALRRVSLGDKRSSNNANVTSGVTALAFDDAVNPGAILWAGTESGAIVAVGFDLKVNKLLSKTKRTVYISSNKSEGSSENSSAFRHPITSLQTKTWLSREARDPTLLANAGPNNLLLFRILSKPLGALQISRSIALSESPPPSLSSSASVDALDLPVRSNFCPLMSFSEGACVISGSLDCGINFFDVARDSARPCVNRLLGHAAPTLDVAFNYDESLLASCDASGLVIVWKREKIS